MEKPEKYLPVGSVVLLEGGEKKLFIAGFCSIPEEESTDTFDYTGYMYPEGFISADEIFLFNHSDIKEVFHIGYADEEEAKFKEALVEAMNEYERSNQEGQ